MGSHVGMCVILFLNPTGISRANYIPPSWHVAPPEATALLRAQNHPGPRSLSSWSRTSAEPNKSAGSLGMLHYLSFPLLPLLPSVPFFLFSVLSMSFLISFLSLSFRFPLFLPFFLSFVRSVGLSFFSSPLSLSLPLSLPSKADAQALLQAGHRVRTLGNQESQIPTVGHQCKRHLKPFLE